MCKSSIFVLFEIITKCTFLYSIIQKLMTWEYFCILPFKKSCKKSIGCMDRYSYVHVACANLLVFSNNAVGNQKCVLLFYYPLLLSFQLKKLTFDFHFL
jgi:hypothetical protein